MHRFFLPPECFREQEVTFPTSVARQMSSVLRLHPGQRVIAIDRQGFEHEVELLKIERGTAYGRAHSSRMVASEPHTRLTLYLCLTQREKFEGMLQKGTELGAYAFVPVISSRSLVQHQDEPSKKHERWQRIVQEAAEQSGRGRVPVVHPTQPFETALQQASQENDRLLIPWEREQQTDLHQVLVSAPGEPIAAQTMRVAVVIGPEGGFSTEEIAFAEQAGFQSITLGPRILRMETAAIVITALVLYELG